MHGWGHAQDKGVTHLNLGNVPESKTDSSGFPTFGAEDSGVCQDCLLSPDVPADMWCVCVSVRWSEMAAP